MEWRATHENCHALFKLPFISIHNMAYDLMHCKHMGTDAYYLGSVLFLLCYEVMPKSPTDNLADVMAVAVRHWTDQG
eukprot:7823447-Alexandrium_andersonii.AAC.1